MIEKAVEFLRISDLQPSDTKVRNRVASAEEFITQLSEPSSLLLLLTTIQGVVSGFDKSPFEQQAPAVVAAIQAIKAKDITLPADLSENATELRAFAALTIGEMLSQQPTAGNGDARLFTSLALRSALTVRPTPTAKPISMVLQQLLSLADGILKKRGDKRRKPGSDALEALEDLESAAPATDLWQVVVPALRSAISEINEHAAIDREELEILWWMFTGHSDIEKMPVAGLTPSIAAFCCGIELSKRSLLPPTPSSSEMVKRSVIAGRGPADLAAISVKDFVENSTPSIRSHFLSTNASINAVVSKAPSLLPLMWACGHLSDSSDSPKLTKGFTTATGLALTLALTPVEWGSQVFREQILLRMLSNSKEL